MAQTVMSGTPMTSSRMAALLTATLLLFACVLCARAEEASPVRVGIVTFLSGPGAGPMGVPARNAAELLFDALNSGAVPKPYQTRGFGGNPVEMVLIDEAGATSTVVTQYRNLVAAQQHRHRLHLSGAAWQSRRWPKS
jgi:branched-chain amino acid transport system substrate-binding protein